MSAGMSSKEFSRRLRVSMRRIADKTGGVYSPGPKVVLPNGDVITARRQNASNGECCAMFTRTYSDASFARSDMFVLEQGDNVWNVL